MIGRLFRILSGFILACLAAGLTKVLFAYTPIEMQSMPPEIAGDRLALALPIATHAAIFSAPFALIAIWFGEWRKRRDWFYYTAAAVVISMIGLAAQYSSETDQMGWSVFNNNYPLMAFISTGVAGGLVYWLFSGRLAGIETQVARNHGNGQRPMTSTTVSTKG